MKLMNVLIVAIAAAAFTGCCYRPAPRPCAPSYCAPVCGYDVAPARPVKRTYVEHTIEK